MFDKLKAGLVSVKEQKAISVSITASAFNTLLKKYRIEAIDEASVAIEDGLVIVSGMTKVKKFGVSKELQFELHLKPVQVNGRTLQFELVKLKPLDFNQINKRLLQRPPVITYDDRLISVDLNAIDVVSKVPVGNIKSFSVEQNKVIVAIGL